MSLNVEDLRRKARSFRSRADATLDVRERDACLALARDYEACLASLHPRTAADHGTHRSDAAEADGAQRSASRTAKPELASTHADLQNSLRLKAGG